MGQSLVKNFLHIVFSTRYREPFITAAVAPVLYDYLGGICRGLDCSPIIVGGHLDHVHILCLLSKKIALSDFVRELKGDSSRWIKLKTSTVNDFYWQKGYGAFSVSPRGVDKVKTYIMNQNEHHKKKTFKNEFRRFLRSHNVEYDERYVWD
jgi:REP element-mobilizing transposase RayT